MHFCAATLSMIDRSKSGQRCSRLATRPASAAVVLSNDTCDPGSRVAFAYETRPSHGALMTIPMTSIRPTK